MLQGYLRLILETQQLVYEEFSNLKQEHLNGTFEFEAGEPYNV